MVVESVETPYFSQDARVGLEVFGIAGGLGALRVPYGSVAASRKCCARPSASGANETVAAVFRLLPRSLRNIDS